MRVSWRNVMTVSAAAIGVLALNVSPASAAPNWQSWVQPSDYRCGTTTLHYHSVNIAHQTCIIRNPNNNTYQAVDIVANNYSAGVYLEARVQRPGRAGSDTCPMKLIPAHTRVACYGDSGAATESVISASSSTLMNDYIADGTTVATYP